MNDGREAVGHQAWVSAEARRNEPSISFSADNSAEILRHKPHTLVVTSFAVWHLSQSAIPTMSSEEEPIKPFKLSITPKQRESVFELARASLVSLKSVHKANATPAAAGAQENYRDGLDSQTVENLCDYFVNRYDWRKHEAEFNNMGQHYTYQVNDVPGEEEPLVLHFIHTVCLRSPGSRTL